MFKHYFAVVICEKKIAHFHLMLPCYLINSVVLDENWSPKDDCMKMMWGQLLVASQRNVTNKLWTNLLRILTFRKCGTEISTDLKGFNK